MNHKKVKIRKAEQSDVEAIVGFSYALFQEDAGQRDPSMNLEWAKENGAAYFSELIASDKNIGLLALVEDNVIGYLVGRVREATSLSLIKKADLESMFVEEQYRGQGVGAQLAQMFLKWAIEQGVEQITVTAYAANERAIAFYQGLGFKPKNLTLALGVKD